MARSVIIIRTNRWSENLQAWVDFLKNETGRALVVVADERKEKIPVPESIAKISLDREKLEALGLFAPPDAAWRCGDYCLIAAYDLFPEAENYWLLDDDVRINSDSVKEFMEDVDGFGADFVAPSLQEVSDGWGWTKTIKPFYSKAYGCYFPITRYSAKAAAVVALGRRELSKRFTEERIAEDLWPNDEVFTASSIMNAGLLGVSFNVALKDSISDKTFTWRSMPFSGCEFDGIPADDKIYHPVLSGRYYYESLLSFLPIAHQKCKNKEDMKMMFEAAEKWLLLEGLSDKIEDFKRKVDVELSLYDSPILRGGESQLLAGELYKVSLSKQALFDKEIYFYVTNPSDYIQSCHVRGEFYENYELNLIKDFFPPAGRFLDVGAYNGNHSIFAGIFLRARKIYLCEPNPEILEACVLNLRLNNLYSISDVRGLGVALSDKEGRCGIVWHPNNMGAASLVECEGQAANIVLKRGDELYSDCEFDFIKIDVGGGVLKVLSGFEGLLKQQTPALGIHYFDNEASDVFSYLNSFGYVEVKNHKRYGNSMFSIFVSEKLDWLGGVFDVAVKGASGLSRV
jgi:FkbM family methyltransferase